MLTTSKTPKYAYLRRVAVLPLFAISLILISFQLSAQESKAKKSAVDQKRALIDQKRAALDQKRASLDQQRAALDQQRAMLEQGIIALPVPPSGAPVPPTPPVPPNLPESISITKLNGNVDSSSIVMKGMRDGKEITVTVKGSNKNISPKDQGNLVLKPSSGDKMKPLIVIDGVITSEMNLNDLNPTNIQSMNVLKGEGARVKYGEKGANGVVEITTKKP